MNFQDCYYRRNPGDKVIAMFRGWLRASCFMGDYGGFKIMVQGFVNELSSYIIEIWLRETGKWRTVITLPDMMEK